MTDFHRWKKLAVLASLSLLTACSNLQRSAPPSQAADFLFWKGAVYTVDEGRPWAEAVAVKDGYIQFVGSNEQAKAHIGAETQVIDLDEQMLLPGFIDTHAHPVLAAGMSHALTLDINGTPETWLEAVAASAKDNPTRPYVYGFGFLASAFGPSGPTKEMLDSVVSDRPVVLVDEGGHSAWVNSRALEVAGIDKDFPDPIPGLHYFKRDTEGNPTGWCLETMTFRPIVKELGVMSIQSTRDGAEDLFWLMSSFGITTVFDAGMSSFQDVGLQVLGELEREGRLPFRVVGSHSIQSPMQVAGAIERLRDLQKTYGSELIAPRVMKIFSDGTKEAYTAAQFEDYVGQPGNKGALFLEGKLLRDFVSDVDKAGFDIHIHAIGDRAVDTALDAFESVRRSNPSSTARYSMAHVELARDEDLPRFGALGVVAQTTPYWFATDVNYEAESIGIERASKLYRFAKIEREGGRITFGSDFPATGDIVGLFPVLNIEMGMTRKMVDQPEMPTTPPVDAVLSLETMIKGYTLNAAYQLNLERELGSIEVGKRADIIVLTQNLFELDTYDIHNARVDITMLNGEVVYQRGWRSLLAEWVLGM